MATVFLLAQEGRIPSQPLHLGLLTLWIVAIINAWNLLDNMDGLVGGVGAIACLTIAIGFLPSSAAVESLLMVVLAGSLLGFLVHNFSPASVYLGDTGTHVLGFTLATVPLYSMDLREPDWYHSVVLLTMLLVPIGDTGFVAIRRILGNRPLYVGGEGPFITLAPFSRLQRTTSGVDFLLRCPGLLPPRLLACTSPDYAVRREKAAIFSGCETHAATVAPAGSNRRSRGGNESAEAFGVEGRVRRLGEGAGRNE